MMPYSSISELITSPRVNYQKKNKIKNIAKLIGNTNPDIQVIISGLIHREDREVNDGIASINSQLECYCNSKNVLFVNNNNMKSSYLAKDKL